MSSYTRIRPRLDYGKLPKSNIVSRVPQQPRDTSSFTTQDGFKIPLTKEPPVHQQEEARFFSHFC